MNCPHVSVQGTFTPKSLPTNITSVRPLARMRPDMSSEVFATDKCPGTVGAAESIEDLVESLWCYAEASSYRPTEAAIQRLQS